VLRIDRILKPWNESGSLNAQINLYGFWNDEVFLTKSGDLGIVLRVRGVDYESLDQAAQEYAVKRLEAALKIFAPGFHVYQYLLKTNRPNIPFESSDDPVVNNRAPIGARNFGSIQFVNLVYLIANRFKRLAEYGVGEIERIESAFVFRPKDGRRMAGNISIKDHFGRDRSGPRQIRFSYVI
jgi:hypothetical protein